ncbi:hypothetical protein RSC2_03713 [Bacillus paralicheniformis]|nr:hypothetical protein RSC1_01857 [Bacillus paralicheniformis]BCE11917.1 hypothetical protein RSC2_03713 [Bacillus paralicheniformis]BCE13530.1 hypothetical protein RSC3_00886 [Bacillus paralicheniformis]
MVWVPMPLSPTNSTASFNMLYAVLLLIGLLSPSRLLNKNSWSSLSLI